MKPVIAIIDNTNATAEKTNPKIFWFALKNLQAINPMNKASKAYIKTALIWFPFCVALNASRAASNLTCFF